MPLPLIPVVLSALAAGGSLVPHAAGGLIVTAAGGYVAGTYLSTATLMAIFAGGVTALGAGVAVVTGATGVIGGAGLFGTTVGATGITGLLMSAGIIASTPVWVPIAIAGAGAGATYGAYRYYALRRKILATPDGAEAQFTEKEAQVIEWILRKLPKE
jgi:hypothetical protein